MTKARKLRELLARREFFIAPGAYDAMSARLVYERWFPAVKLLGKRPIAVLSVYLGSTLLGLLLAAVLLLLRPYIGHGSVPALVLGLLLSGAVAMALAWGRIARLFGMQALAEDVHARR